MADSVQATKDAIWYLQKDIDKAEAERKEWVDVVSQPHLAFLRIHC